MKNEELRMKNWGAERPSPSQVFDFVCIAKKKF